MPSRPSPVLGSFRTRVQELFTENKTFPKKQQYTSHKIYTILVAEGYQGSESHLRRYITQLRREQEPPHLYLPLDYEPGQDAQVDWGEAIAVIGGIRQTVQVFVMRLCYSRRTFVMTFPSQNQESFLFAHVQAFQYFGGVPARISYDNLATAVKLAMGKKRKRTENTTFVAFRSHYLFESHFCTPGAGWEKGQVEHGVGYGRRNYLVPIPEASSFEELNRAILERCLQDDQRRVSRQTLTIGQAWEQERPLLQPLPQFAYDRCDTLTVRLTPYSQATYETNRYSVPVKRARRDVIIKAYPFHIEMYDQHTLLARHPRCYGREQDIFDPLHYLPLLAQRPGAFEYATPMKQWRKEWPQSYHQMLAILKEKWPEGRGCKSLSAFCNYIRTILQTSLSRRSSLAVCIGMECSTVCIN